jgi:hypothetical protein
MKREQRRNTTCVGYAIFTDEEATDGERSNCPIKSRSEPNVEKVI